MSMVKKNLVKNFEIKKSCEQTYTFAYNINHQYLLLSKVAHDKRRQISNRRLKRLPTVYSSWCTGTDKKIGSTNRGSRCGSTGQEQNCWYTCGRIVEMASRNSDCMSLKVKEFEAKSIIFCENSRLSIYWKIVSYSFSVSKQISWWWRLENRSL